VLSAGDPVGGVQRDRIPHDGDALRRDVLLAQELRGQVGVADLESLVVVCAIAQPDVVQDAFEEEQFLVVVGAGSQVAGAG